MNDAKPATLLEVRDRMRARNDAHAKAEGHAALPRAVALRDLPGTIAKDNADRAEREGQDSARAELLLACASLGPEVARVRSTAAPELADFLDTVGLFHGAIAEYLRADGHGKAARMSAIHAMRDAIASLDRVRGLR